MKLKYFFDTSQLSIFEIKVRSDFESIFRKEFFIPRIILCSWRPNLVVLIWVWFSVPDRHHHHGHCCAPLLCIRRLLLGTGRSGGTVKCFLFFSLHFSFFLLFSSWFVSLSLIEPAFSFFISLTRTVLYFVIPHKGCMHFSRENPFVYLG